MARFVSFLSLILSFVAFVAAQKEAVGLRAGNSGNTTLSGCSYSATCTASGIEGVCVSVSAGCCSGTTTSGLCPGSSDIMCCTNNKCTTPSGSGTCMQTSKCTGKSYSGYCTGPSDLQCCVGITPAPTTSTYGVDISDALSTSGASCFISAGVSFIIPRGFRSTGAVDTNVCTSIKNAASAGIKTRDTYMFPCSSLSACILLSFASIFSSLFVFFAVTYIGPTCSSSAASQMSQLVSYLNSNCKSQWSGRIWLDIEGSQYWTSSTSSNQAWYKVSNTRAACMMVISPFVAWLVSRTLFY